MGPEAIINAFVSTVVAVIMSVIVIAFLDGLWPYVPKGPLRGSFRSLVDLSLTAFLILVAFPTVGIALILWFRNFGNGGR